MLVGGAATLLEVKCSTGPVIKSLNQDFNEVHARRQPEAIVYQRIASVCCHGRAARPQLDSRRIRAARDREFRERLGGAREEAKEAFAGTDVV